MTNSVFATKPWRCQCVMRCCSSLASASASCCSRSARIRASRCFLCVEHRGAPFSDGDVRQQGRGFFSKNRAMSTQVSGFASTNGEEQFKFGTRFDAYIRSRMHLRGNPAERKGGGIEEDGFVDVKMTASSVRQSGWHLTPHGTFTRARWFVGAARNVVDHEGVKVRSRTF